LAEKVSSRLFFWDTSASVSRWSTSAKSFAVGWAMSGLTASLSWANRAPDCAWLSVTSFL
jgi:hypothetical protein